MALCTVSHGSVVTRSHSAHGLRVRVPRSHSGQSLLEVAFMLPFLLLLLLGVIEVGRYAYIGILVANAAHAGAMYGSQGTVQSGDTAGIAAAANNDFANNGMGSTLTVSSSYACGCDSGGTVTAEACSPPTCSSGHWTITVTVIASGTFSGLFSYPGIPSSVAISRTATMRVNLFGS